MKKFSTKEGVDTFQTGGPNGLLVVERAKPLLTDDPAEIAVLEGAAGRRALDSEDVAQDSHVTFFVAVGEGQQAKAEPKGKPEPKGGDRS